MTSEVEDKFDDGRYWPVVAEFFVSVLAVFVVLSSAVSQPPVVPPDVLQKVRGNLDRLKGRGLLDHYYEANDREILMIYSTQYLGFDPCSWALASERAREVQESVRVLEGLGDHVARLSIEGHADERRPSGCKQMRFGTNFELSQNRAMAVFAAMLGKTMEELDEAAKEARDAMSERRPQSLTLVGTLTGRKRVVVAGYGATRPRVPENPEDERNRRVELRAVLDRTDLEASEPTTLAGNVTYHGNTQRLAPSTDPKVEQDPPVEETVRRIRGHVTTITQELGGYDCHTRVLDGVSAEGGELRACYAGAELTKLTAIYYGESGRASEDYFFWRGELVFVFARAEVYTGHLSGVAAGHRERRFYFEGGRLVRQLESAGGAEVPSPPEGVNFGQYLPKQARILAACAADSSRGACVASRK